MNLLFFIVLPCRMSILKKLGHIDADGLVLLKGRAACQVSRGSVAARLCISSLLPPVSVTSCQEFSATNPWLQNPVLPCRCVRIHLQRHW